MGDELRALLCESFGLPDTANDAQAKAHLGGVLNVAGIEASEDEAVVVKALKKHLTPNEGPPATSTEPPAGGTASQVTTQVDVAKAIRDAAREDRRLASAIRTECERFGFKDQADALIDKCDSLEAAREEILELVAKRQSESDSPGATLEVGSAQLEKHDAQVRTAYLMSSLSFSGFQQDTIDSICPPERRAAGWEDWQYASMFDIATQCLQMRGVNTRGLTRERVAMCALGFFRQAGVRATDYGYHTTGDFTDLTLDAINKTLLAAYQEAPSTWETVFRRARSVPDFKTIHRVRLGEVPNLDQWPDNMAPNNVAIANERESYAVEAYASEMSFSYRLLVNDDMDALTSIPVKMGTAARRTVNSHVWSIITSNPTMVDGQSLFSAATGNRQNANLVSASSGAPNVARIGTGRELMRLQTGVNTPEQAESQAILNLSPSFIVVPANLETTTEQLVQSAVDPDGTVTGVFNPFRSLMMVTEPLLDANSTTAWYLFARPSLVDTVECTFLQGQETPQVRSWQDNRTLALMYSVLQSFAAKAIDHRGCFRDDGV
jgi:hypothetical protein